MVPELGPVAPASHLHQFPYCTCRQTVPNDVNLVPTWSRLGAKLMRGISVPRWKVATTQHSVASSTGSDTPCSRQRSRMWRIPDPMYSTASVIPAGSPSCWLGTVRALEREELTRLSSFSPRQSVHSTHLRSAGSAQAESAIRHQSGPKRLCITIPALSDHRSPRGSKQQQRDAGRRSQPSCVQPASRSRSGPFRTTDTVRAPPKGYWQPARKFKANRTIPIPPSVDCRTHAGELELLHVPVRNMAEGMLDTLTIRYAKPP